jgi:CRP/FNR family transcriptional regulator, cyclic AMP receptor protein
VPKPPSKRSLAERIADLGQVREYPPRTVIFHEGDHSDLIYVVLSGHLEVFLADSEGREIVINEMGSGELFGEMSLDGNPRSASVITAQPCRLSVVSPQAIRGLLATDADAAFELLVTVIRRTRNATRVAGDLALMGAYERLSRLLVELAEPMDDGNLVIENRPTQQRLGDRIGATREMVSRIFTDMRVKRFIADEKKRIIIFKPLKPTR